MFVALSDKELSKIRSKYKVKIIDDNAEMECDDDISEMRNKPGYTLVWNNYAKYKHDDYFYFTKIDYGPIKNLDKLLKLRFDSKTPKRCDYNKQFPNLLYIDKGKQIKINGYDMIQFPPGTTFYKGTHYFFDKLSDADYIWVGNYFIGMIYASRYSGGCMVYKNIKPLNLFILNKTNIQKLYKKFIVDGSQKVKKAFQLKFGVGVTILDHIAMILQYNNWTDNEIWIYNTRDKYSFTYCQNPKKDAFYGAGYNDRLVADTIYKLKDDLGIHGWFSPETLTPFTKATAEEILLFNNSQLIIDTKDPYFWKNWIQSAGIELPINFVLNPTYSRANYEFNVIKFYNKYNKSNVENIQSGADRFRPRLIIMSYNMKYLDSPNALMTEDEIFNKFIMLLKQIGPDIIALQEFPNKYIHRLSETGYHFYHTENGGKDLNLVVLTQKNAKVTYIKYYTRRPRSSIMISYDGLTFAATHLEIGERYISRSGSVLRFPDFYNMFMKNSKIRTAQLINLLKNRPDFILGDLNFGTDTTEFGFIKKYFRVEDYVRDIPATSIHGTTIDYILQSRRLGFTEKNYVVHSTLSDHLPIVKFIK